MVECMVSRSIDNLLQRMSSNHVGIMNLKNCDCQESIKRRRQKKRTKIVQKLMSTNRTRYKTRCKGKMKTKRWYGTDCRKPSTGWNA